HFDRHVAIQFGVARAIDLAHAARAEQRPDLVRPQTRSAREDHGYFVGTRAFSSSNQFNTTSIRCGAVAPVSCPGATMPSSRPSLATSWLRSAVCELPMVKPRRTGIGSLNENPDCNATLTNTSWPGPGM